VLGHWHVQSEPLLKGQAGDFDFGLLSGQPPPMRAGMLLAGAFAGTVLEAIRLGAEAGGQAQNPYKLTNAVILAVIMRFDAPGNVAASHTDIYTYQRLPPIFFTNYLLMDVPITTFSLLSMHSGHLERCPAWPLLKQ
jgi:hypothetical protein